MTNTGFVALPILRATYGAPAVLPAAIATVFVAVVMFPAAVLMQELDPHSRGGSVFAPAKLARHVILNPMVLSTLVGIAWAAAGVPMPGPVNAYLQILADALTACALFAIGLGVSIEGLRSNIGRSAALAAVKLALMPLIVLGLSIALGLEPLYPHRSRRVRGGSDRQDGLHPIRRISLRATDRRRDHLAHDVMLDRHAYRLDLCFSEVFSVGVRRRPPTFENLL